MLLTGTFVRTIDEQHRIAVPKPLREVLIAAHVDVLFVAPGTDGSLSLYSEEAFSELGHRLAQASPTSREVRDYGRLFYARAIRAEIDQQGRIRIPKELVDLADLEKDVVLLGVQNHIELWDRDRWEIYFQDKQAQYDEIAEAAFGYPATPNRDEMTAGQQHQLSENEGPHVPALRTPK